MPIRMLTCPDCKNKLEVNEEEVSRGVILRGKVYTYTCPKCGCTFRKFTRSYLMSTSASTSIKRTLTHFSAYIGEDIAFRVLEWKGFEISGFLELERELGDYYKTFYNRWSEEYLRQFFTEKQLQNFIKFCKAWTEGPDTLSGKYRKPTKWTPRARFGFGPDYVGKKDGKFYLIEVKTNKAVLTKYQKKMLLKAKDFGFIPLIIRLKVELKAPLDEVRIEEIH